MWIKTQDEMRAVNCSGFYLTEAKRNSDETLIMGRPVDGSEEVVLGRFETMKEAKEIFDRAFRAAIHDQSYDVPKKDH